MKTLIRYFMKRIREDKIGAYAAQSALFLIMSIIPFLLVVVWVLSFTVIPEELLLSAIGFISPDMITDSMLRIVDELYHSSGGLVVVSIVVAVYSAAKTIQSLRNGLNLAYDVEETRGWAVLRLRAMLETLILVMAILLLMVLLMFGRRIQDILVMYIPWVAQVTAVILRYRLLILFVALILILMLIYRIIPNRRVKWSSRLLGSAICAAVWYILTFAMSIYINYSNVYSLYGSLTSLVLIMFWLYFAMFAFLVCGMINSSTEMIFIELRLARKYRRQQRTMKREERERSALGEGEDPGPADRSVDDWKGVRHEGEIE